MCCARGSGRCHARSRCEQGCPKIEYEINGTARSRFAISVTIAIFVHGIPHADEPGADRQPTAHELHIEQSASVDYIGPDSDVYLSAARSVAKTAP